MRDLLRTLALCLVLGAGHMVRAQGTITDSVYFRIPDRAKAMEAIRFDLAAYSDTLRVYRDALATATTRLDASTPAGEDRKARLGHLRRDVQSLDKEMKRLRKQVRKSAPPFEPTAHTCARLVQQVKGLRGRVIAEGVRPEP